MILVLDKETASPAEKNNKLTLVETNNNEIKKEEKQVSLVTPPLRKPQGKLLYFPSISHTSKENVSSSMATTTSSSILNQDNKNYDKQQKNKEKKAISKFFFKNCKNNSLLEIPKKLCLHSANCDFEKKIKLKINVTWITVKQIKTKEQTDKRIYFNRTTQNYQTLNEKKIRRRRYWYEDYQDQKENVILPCSFEQ